MRPDLRSAGHIWVNYLSGGGTHQLTALASAGTTVTGIGSTATAQRQQPFILTLTRR